MNGNITVQEQMIALLRKNIPKLVAQDIVGVQPMSMSAGAFFAPYKPKSLKYKFSRAKWYVAEYDNAHHHEVLAWCSQHFGPYPTRPDAWSRWFNMFSEKIHFRDEKDYIWFTLRWS